MNPFSFSVGTIWFWIGTVDEPFGWKDVANMYGERCLTETPTPYDALVFAEVQTMDCGINSFYS